MIGLRQDDRIQCETLCAEYVGDKERFGIVVDVSENGLRVQRPLGGGRAGGIVQLEFELPEVDEVIWAKGAVCFDQVWRVPPKDGSLSGVLRTSGIRLVAAANRHLKMIRDYVRETARLREYARAEEREHDDWLLRAASYLSG